jgi:C-3',4' desaturase CrtD
MKRILVIGAGFGGLAAAAELSQRGHAVTVLEAHVYPGGSAGTFYHQGYRFDAGATLAGGFAPGGVMDQLGLHLNIDWQATLTSQAMLVHLPDGSTVTRWTEPDRWRAERIGHFGEQAEPFWGWQETTADALWDLAFRLPPWPPQNAEDFKALSRIGFEWLKRDFFQNLNNQFFSLVSDAVRPIKRHMPPGADKFRQFIDAQLLISAQTTSSYANALYSSAALDLARQGVAHIPGGMGGIADKLVATIKSNGGEVHFRQEVTRVSSHKQGYFFVETKRKTAFQGDVVIFNLPPWNITQLLKEDLPGRLRRLPEHPQHGWGAFMLYIGLDNELLQKNLPLHHQIVVREPLAEGNSIFMSLSPEWDLDRAPHGKRALTISTHTQLQPWWQLFNDDQEAYDNRKNEYTDRILQAGEIVFPNLRSAVELILPGTPITFQRFTRRFLGWVGGFPQTKLLRNWGPRLSPGLWMVGDSIFPGQSVPAVMLGGIRVADAVIARESLEKHVVGHSFKYQRKRLLNLE